MNKEIVSINTYWVEDENADVSYLETTAEEHYGENGSAWSHISDELKAKTKKEYGSIWKACEEYARKDAERLAAFERGEWHMKGCRAEAKVSIGGTLQTIKTAGLWGIESDTVAEYFALVEKSEVEDLIKMLASMGFSTEGKWQW